MIEVLNFLKSRIGSVRSSSFVFNELPASCDGKVFAVDGGSCIIADGGSWVLSKLKTCLLGFSEGSRLVSEELRNELYYSVIKGDSGFEHSLSDVVPEFGNVRELTEVPALIMRFLEFKLALDAVRKLSSGSILLIDGLLIAESKFQEVVLRELEIESRKRGVIVAGLAKTFRLGVNGRPVIGSLLNLRPGSSWFVKLPSCFIIKLHDRAKFAYALSLFDDSLINKLLPVLAFYSSDAELIGYPYPLLKVDREARISSFERRLEMHKFRILSRKEGFDFLTFDESSTSMHSLMDIGKYR